MGPYIDHVGFNAITSARTFLANSHGQCPTVPIVCEVSFQWIQHLGRIERFAYEFCGNAKSYLRSEERYICLSSLVNLSRLFFFIISLICWKTIDNENNDSLNELWWMSLNAGRWQRRQRQWFGWCSRLAAWVTFKRESTEEKQNVEKVINRRYTGQKTFRYAKLVQNTRYSTI